MWDADGIETDGPVIQAMTEDKFIEVLMNAKMIENPSENLDVCFRVDCVYCCNNECHITKSNNLAIRAMIAGCSIAYRCTDRITKK